MKSDVHWLKEVKKGGRVIILDDESIWEIAPSHAGDTCTWDLVSGIAVSAGKDSAFPFRLINTGIGESVDARHLGRRPGEAAPAIPAVQRTNSSSTAVFPA
ncbi:MAG: hypothetical protein AMJ54_11135 [Deltaproteobacteria bacterium SG8_13]|nr:MAG: hypothetical protein AMJ54_11135 [Deltaproteobacteria bacterium SG8_13]